MKQSIVVIFLCIISISYGAPTEKEEFNHTNATNSEGKQFFWYFAYGSNLLKERIRVQVTITTIPTLNKAQSNKGAEYYTNGELAGFKLRFVNYAPRWHGGVATISQEKDSQVVGCVWKVPMDNSASLDDQEFDYRRLTVPIKCETGEVINCRTYQYLNDAAVDTPPSPHYKTVIVTGAIEHKLPEAYIKKLKAIPDNGYKGKVEVDLDAIRHLTKE